LSREVRAPLFDRLVDRDPRLHGEPRPFRTLTPGELRESVRCELSRLLNTREPLPSRALGDRTRTVIDYGVPDFSSYSPRNHDDRQRLAEALRQAIDAYEPRLRQARVAVEPVPGDDQALVGRIDALLVVEEVHEPISFATIFESDRVEVLADAGE
jgi:type VI secretion system lysozyme-like protein